MRRRHEVVRQGLIRPAVVDHDPQINAPVYKQEKRTHHLVPLIRIVNTQPREFLSDILTRTRNTLNGTNNRPTLHRLEQTV
jgi:hypothetical protein